MFEALDQQTRYKRINPETLDTISVHKIYAKNSHYQTSPENTAILRNKLLKQTAETN